VSGWRTPAYAAARPLLFRFEAERIHELTLKALRIAGDRAAGRWALRLAGGAPSRRRPWAELMGLRFTNRVGLGAGFDKNGVALRAWAALGFGFAEVGTVTPLPQAGNPRPRLFRLAEDEALINRMGFNNDGAAAAARQIMLARRRLPGDFVVGVNIGRGRETPADHAIDDYLEAYRQVAPVADYVTVNVSSPNTPGLRDLQEAGALHALLHALAAAGERLNAARPILVKLDPDLPAAEFGQLLAALGDAPLAGLILSNTTLAREGLASDLTAEAGGLSGRPLLAGMLERVAAAQAVLGARVALVASGGIAAAADVTAAYEAGADLVQLWSGMVYRGPGLIGEAAAVPGRPAAGGW
jgi:dihydroorotate dehydrogenase